MITTPDAHDLASAATLIQACMMTFLTRLSRIALRVKADPMLSREDATDLAILIYFANHMKTVLNSRSVGPATCTTQKSGN